MSGRTPSAAESSRNTEDAGSCACSCKDELESLKARLFRPERHINSFGRQDRKERPTLRVKPNRRGKRRAEEQSQPEEPSQRSRYQQRQETSNIGDDVVAVEVVDLTSGNEVDVDRIVNGPAVVLPTASGSTSDDLLFFDAVEYCLQESTVVFANVKAGPSIVSVLFLKPCFHGSILEIKARITCLDSIGQFVIKGMNINGQHSCGCCNQIQPFCMSLSYAETGICMLVLPFNVIEEVLAAITRPTVGSLLLGQQNRWTRISGKLTQTAVLPERTDKIVQVAKAGLRQWSRRYANYVPLVNLDFVQLRP